MSDYTEEPCHTTSRRGFIAGGIAAFAGVVACWPLIRAIGNLPPDHVAEDLDDWRLVLSKPELITGILASAKGVRRIETRRIVADRWRLREEPMALFIVRTGDALNAPDALTVFSSICPHAGCPVTYQKDEERFFCPCHDGTFALDGRVLDGPPPRSLDPLPHRIDGDGLHIRLRRFKLNTPERTAL